MLASARGQVLALWNALDTVMALDNNAADSIDCQIYRKAHSDRAAAYYDNISLHDCDTALIEGNETESKKLW